MVTPRWPNHSSFGASFTARWASQLCRLSPRPSPLRLATRSRRALCSKEFPTAPKQGGRRLALHTCAALGGWPGSLSTASRFLIRAAESASLRLAFQGGGRRGGPASRGKSVRATPSPMLFAPQQERKAGRWGSLGRPECKRGRSARRMAGEGPAQSRLDTKAGRPAPSAPLKPAKLCGLERLAGIPEAARSCCCGGGAGPGANSPPTAHLGAAIVRSNCWVSRFPPALKLH